MQRIPIVIHGLMGVLPFISKGTRNIDKLVDALPHPQDSKDFLQISLTGAQRYVAQMEDKYGKIEILSVSHSMGCYRNIQLAKWCAKRGIIIRYTAAIDPTAINRLFGMTPMVVTPNMVEVEEFHARYGVPSMSRVRSPDGKRGGKYIYPPNWSGTRAIHKYQQEHIALASYKPVVDHIVKKVEGYL